ncbi:MAG: hypothetical protein AAF196_03755 [Planctomycetota bacterium]
MSTQSTDVGRKPDPVDRDWVLGTRVAALGFALMALGGIRRWSNDESDIFGLLWQELDRSEATALTIESSLLVLVAIAGSFVTPLALLGCHLRRPALVSRLGVAGLWTLGIWASLWTISSTIRDPWHPEWIPAARAARWLGPLACVFWLSASPERRRLGQRLALLAIAATFIAHGVEAYLGRPSFVDLVHALHRRIGTKGWSDSDVESLLIAIAVIDWFAAATLLLGSVSRIAGPVRNYGLGWMAVWGFVTALSRIVQTGETGIPEALIRAPHATLPLALVFTFRKRNGTQAGTVRM